MTATATLTAGTLVTDKTGLEAFVRYVHGKSNRAIVVYTQDDLLGYESMRSINSLTVKVNRKGEARQVRNLKTAISRARAGLETR